VNEPEVGKDRGLINVRGDLLGSPLGGDMLRLHQLRAALFSGEADQVLGYLRHRPSRALLPRRVGRRVHYDLTDSPPARVV
jgi:hypothetical protein